MTQCVYTRYVTFQTNGDCSSFQITFPDDEKDEFIEKYRENLIDNGFPIIYPNIPEPKSIVFSTIAMK